MFKKVDKNANRIARHKRVRKTVKGTPERPRLNVYRSTNNIYVQIVDDINRITLDKELKGTLSSTSNKDAAKKVGELAAKRALEKGIDTVVFDRGGYIYHGRIQELAEAAREAGLKF